MITLEAMSVAELLMADPLARGRAVACQLLPKQRRLLDDVDGAGLWGRSRLGSGNEESSNEQRNDDTHRYPPWSDGTVPPVTEGYLANSLLVDESG
jgi:hypothetical protein